MNTTPTSYLTVLHDAKEWSTEIEGEIGEIRVDGKKISDVHELALRITKLQKTYNILCLISAFAFIALLVSFLKMVPDPVLVEQHMEKVDEIYKKVILLGNN